MVMVYDAYGPRPPAEGALYSQMALEAVFGERTDPVRSWRIFVDPEKITSYKGPERMYMNLREFRRDLARRRKIAEKLGAEPGQVQIGTLVSTVKKLVGGTRAELKTNAHIMFPPGMMPIALQAFGKMRLDSVSYVSMDKGLEDFRTTFVAGAGLEVIAKGFREGDRVRINQSVFNQKKKLLEERLDFEVKDVSVPTTSPSPFHDRPSIDEGAQWEIPILDTTSSSGQPRLTSLTARVTGMEEMKYHGKTVHVFHVEARNENRRASAYFSADGRVLKEEWTFADLLPVTLIRNPNDQDK
jgi:hypothetical protein